MVIVKINKISNVKYLAHVHVHIKDERKVASFLFC